PGRQGFPWGRGTPRELIRKFPRSTTAGYCPAEDPPPAWGAPGTTPAKPPTPTTTAGPERASPTIPDVPPGGSVGSRRWYASTIPPRRVLERRPVDAFARGWRSPRRRGAAAAGARVGAGRGPLPVRVPRPPRRTGRGAAVHRRAPRRRGGNGPSGGRRGWHRASGARPLPRPRAARRRPG